MRFQFYFPVLVVALACAAFSAGAIFGLGVVSSPKQQPAQVEFKPSNKPEVVHSEADERALTPTYPTAPGDAVAKDDSKSKDAPAQVAKRAATDGRATDKQANNSGDQGKPSDDNTDTQAAAAKPQDKGPPPPKDIQPVASKPVNKTVAPTDRAAAKQASVKRAADVPPARSANSCDVRACSAAYKSFRASDCTYQPYDGPRQLCVNPPAASSYQAALSRPDKRGGHSASRQRDMLEDGDGDDEGADRRAGGL